MKNPLASVRITTYNHERYIEKCLDSILSQKTDFPFEIVIGEDRSTDSTASILKKYQKLYPNLVRVNYSEKNIGPYHNGIRTTRSCRGKYIAMCDGDDYWLSNIKLQRQVDFLESNHDYGVVYGDAELVDINNKAIETSAYFKDRKTRYVSGDIFWNLLDKNFINLSSVCYLKESINDILSQTKEEDLKNWFIVDYFLWLKISQKFKFKFFNEKLAAYRSHNQNLTTVNDFLSRRNPAIIYAICSTLDPKIINTDLKKEIFVKKLISVTVNKHAQLNHRIRFLFSLIIFPFTYKFLSRKILK